VGLMAGWLAVQDRAGFRHRSPVTVGCPHILGGVTQVNMPGRVASWMGSPRT